MKKVLFILVTIMLCFCFVGCKPVFPKASDNITQSQAGEIKDSNESESNISSSDVTNSSGQESSENIVPIIDANEYYANNSEIIKITPASESSKTEEEAYAAFLERGFTNFPITTTYDINGKYISEINISSERSSIKHPVYTTFYCTKAGKYWTIKEIGGVFHALPLSLEQLVSVEILISETNTITGYDSATNQFYAVIPYESFANVKTVNKIDAQTLETIDEVGFEKYFS